jgi:hypothetical protein
MKKLIILLIILTSCNKQPQPTMVNNAHVIEFEFKGHQYIEFEKERMTWGVHNPDCKCKK